MFKRLVVQSIMASGLLLTAFYAAGMAQEVDTLRLGRKVVPLMQEIHLNLDPAQEIYNGTVDIALDVCEQTDYFRLHTKMLEIGKLVLQRANRQINTRWSTSGELLLINTGKPLLPGSCTLHIEFRGRIGSLGSGIFKGIEKDDIYLATQFEPVYARCAFPCWDEPGFRCPFRLTLTTPAGLAAFSNTPIEKTEIKGHTQTVSFSETPPLPVYLVAFAAGPYDTIPLSGMSVPGSVVVPRGQSHLAAEAVQTIPLILQELERRFGLYPFSKLDFVAVQGLMGGMENAGLITLYPTNLLMDPKVCTAEQRLGNWITIAHEIAHMWFGDLVTMAWWDDTWLNEGFAQWIGLDVANTLFPQYNPFSWQIGSTQRAMSTDALPSASAVQRTIRAVDDPFQAFDELSYNKAGAVLDMVSAWIGAEELRNGILDYLGKNKWRSATAGDLWLSLSAAASEPLDSVVASFIGQPGVPLIEAQIIPGPRLKLVQSRFMNSGFPVQSQKWKIPVSFKYSDGKSTWQQSCLMRDEAMILPLECTITPEWLQMNTDEHGYYRWDIPDSMLLEMAANSQRCMNTRERLGFLYNARALLYGGRLHGDTYLEIMRAFSADPDPEVLQRAGSPIGAIHDLFLTPQNAEQFTAYVRTTCHSILDRIGRQKRPDENYSTPALRSMMISLLAEEGQDSGIQYFADSLRKVYLMNPEAVDPELADVVLRASARHGDRELYKTYLQRFESATSHDERSRFAFLLGAFPQRESLDQTLSYLLAQPLNQDDFLNVLSGTANRENKAYLLDWLCNNYAAVTEKIDPIIVTFIIPELVRIPADSLLTKARTFFSDPSRKLQLLDINLNKAADQIATMLRIREQEGPAVDRFLQTNY